MLSPDQLSQLTQLKQVTSKLSAQIIISEKALELSVSAPEGDAEADKAASNLVSQLANQLATQLGSLFGIRGEIVDATEDNKE